MISGTSSVGNPCNLSEGGISNFLIENFGCSLWLWFALGGATAKVVRAVRGASTAEVLRQQRCYVLSGGLWAVLLQQRCYVPSGCLWAVLLQRMCYVLSGGLVESGQGERYSRCQSYSTAVVLAWQESLGAARVQKQHRGFAVGAARVQNNIEVLLRLRYSSHLIYSLVGRPTHRLPAVRQHHLQDPRRRRCAVEHALLEVSGGLDADGVVAGKGAWRGIDVLCHARALLNGCPG